MGQYIDKSALITEIESKKKYAQTLCDNAINSSMQQFFDGVRQGCIDILSFIDTLKVSNNVFIEKAVDYIANNMQCNGYTLQTKAKFINGFKKYLEGE